MTQIFHLVFGVKLPGFISAARGLLQKDTQDDHLQIRNMIGEMRYYIISNGHVHMNKFIDKDMKFEIAIDRLEGLFMIYGDQWLPIEKYGLVEYEKSTK